MFEPVMVCAAVFTRLIVARREADLLGKGVESRAWESAGFKGAAAAPALAQK
jgi:hypothetical protein